MSLRGYLIGLVLVVSAVAIGDAPAGGSPCDGLNLRPGLPVHRQPFYGCAEKTGEMLAADARFLEQVRELGYGPKEGADKSIGLGWRYFQQGRYDVAIARFNQAYLQDPDNPDILHGYALVMLMRDRNAAGAEMLLKRAVADPNVSPGAWADYGRFLLQSKRTDEGMAVPERARERDPRTPELYLLLALGEEDRGDRPRACEHAREAMRLQVARARGLVQGFCTE